MAVATTKSRDTFIGNGVTRLFALDFVFQDASSLSVTLVNNTTLSVTSYVLGVDYTVIGGAGLTGSVSSVSAHSASFTLVVDRVEPTLQAQVYSKYGAFPAKTVEAGFDRLVYQTQRLTASISRTLRQPAADLTDIGIMPNSVSRAGMYLTFNATTGDPECINSVVSVSAIAGISAAIATVASISASVSLVAGISANVTTVAGISAGIATVVGISASISLVAGVSANVTTVAGISASVSTVASISSAVLVDAIINADISTVAAISTSVTRVSGISANVTTVAGISANVTTVAGISAGISTVVGISANVTTVAGISASVSLVAGISASVSLVSGISANVTTVAGISASVSTVASLSSTINAMTIGVGANILHNGDMLLDQRNEGASVTPVNSANTLDRWQSAYVAGGAGAPSVKQQASSSGLPAGIGFQKSLLITCGASGTVSAGEILGIKQIVEGADIADIAFGSASSQSITLSFYAKCSVSALTFSAAFSSSGNAQFYNAPFTMGASATWARYSVTIPGSASGAWATGVGTIGLNAFIILSAGSTFQGASGTWGGSIILGTSATSRLSATSSATFEITGVKLERGSVVTPFVPEVYAAALAKARRYYRKTFLPGTAPAQSAGVSGAITTKNPIALGDPSVYVAFDPPMYANPTVTTYNPSASNANWRDITAGADATVSVDPGTTKSVAGVLLATSGTVSTLGDILAIHYTADALI